MIYCLNIHNTFDGNQHHHHCLRGTSTKGTSIVARNEDIGRDKAGSGDGSVVKALPARPCLLCSGRRGPLGGHDPCAVGAPRAGPARCPAWLSGVVCASASPGRHVRAPPEASQGAQVAPEATAQWRAGCARDEILYGGRGARPPPFSFFQLLGILMLIFALEWMNLCNVNT